MMNASARLMGVDREIQGSQHPEQTENGIQRLRTVLLHGRYSIWLTHGSAIVMTVALFTLLLTLPFRIAFIPAVLLTHRIGVMMHEYIHGNPFRRYANCLRVLAFFDGLMLMFGLLDLFRATHLSHHRWLNSPGDSAFDNQHQYARGVRPLFFRCLQPFDMQALATPRLIGRDHSPLICIGDDAA